MEFFYDENLDLVKIALAEDIGSGDVTSLALVPEVSILEARIIAKESGILCGLPIVEQVYSVLDSAVEVERFFDDGDSVEAGFSVVEVKGPARSVLAGERTAMNFLCHLSGVSTVSNLFSKRLEGTNCSILDTRKTTPGMRALEKYAVTIGGGKNHRLGLWDMILVKENHIIAAGGFMEAMERLFSSGFPSVPVEVEVRDIEELQIALKFPIDRVMLDNFSIENIIKAVEFRRILGAKVPFEVSGKVTLDNCRVYAETGVEFISSGSITHSVRALDFSMIAKFLENSEEL
ncbi:carboxylating nicotinate-nucleotide diphosphorylase [bacterium]|nr:carboxylating nicotinate-nucleotide diphosphorylase [bacterium]